MVSFHNMSLEELRTYNRDAQKRSRRRTKFGEAAEPKRQRGPRGGEIIDETSPILTAGAPSARPTPEMILDAMVRSCAPRSITAWVCGDPPPGRSALDRRSR